MRNLNSVLLEGSATADPVCTETGEDMTDAVFTIEVVREWREDEKIVREERCFQIRAIGRLGSTVGAYLKKGRTVRVVGRLDTDADGVFIKAEHVEFVPKKR